MSTSTRIYESMNVSQWQVATDALPQAPLFADGQVNFACNEEIDDRWLADAYALIATRPELLSHVFASTGNMERDILTLRLFKHGAWQAITIDTMLPCKADGTPLFCRASGGQVLWPSLLTKAMAKLHGSYAALGGGHVAEALVDLTAGHVSHQRIEWRPPPKAAEEAGEAAVEAAARLEELWHNINKGLKRGMLMAMVTPPTPVVSGLGFQSLDGAFGEGDNGSAGNEPYVSGLLPERLYPLIFAREPQPGLRLLCLRSPWVETSKGPDTLRAWAKGSVEWVRYREVAEELLPLSEAMGDCIWMELSDAARSFDEVLSVALPGPTTEAIVMEGMWREDTAGGPRSASTWCINPQYWLTVAKDTVVTIELSVPDPRLPAERRASSAHVQAAAAHVASQLNPDDASTFDDDSAGVDKGFAPISVCVMQGGPPSVMDYGRLFHGDQAKALVGESTPVKRRGTGLTVALSADRAYCVVPCCAAGHTQPFVLRFQSEISFTIKQAQPASVAQLPGQWETASAGGPRLSKTWTTNPQYWLTICPPPTGTALAKVRLRLEAHTLTPSQVSATSAASIGMRSTPGLRGATGRAAPANAPPDVGFTVFRGAFTRERFGRARAGGSGGATASPPPSRPGTASGQELAGRRSPSGTQRPSSSRGGSPPKRPGTANGRPASQQGRREGGMMKAGEYEQLIEYASMDRNNDGIITAAELENYRKLKPNGSQGVTSSLAATLASSTASDVGVPPSPRDAGTTAPNQTHGSGGAHASPAAVAPAAINQMPNGDILPPAGPTPLADESTLDMEPVGPYSLSFGLPVRDTSEMPPTRRHAAEQKELVESVVASDPITSTVLRLDPSLPYVVSVHTAKPGVCCDYTLSAFSDAVISLSLIETTTQRVFRGAWRRATSGGCHMESPEGWTANPQYALNVSSGTDVQIALERPASKWARFNKTHTLEAMMGVYVLRGTAPGAKVNSPEKAFANVVYRSNFIPSHELRFSIYLEPLPDGAPYIVMPTTFGSGMRGPFSLGVTTDRPCSFDELGAEPQHSTPSRSNGE